ncbi:unnamed protein product [Ambrosiozyma monospora]|uniref:Unnamed protein product n=1 Tax=Ambrosiozyma monospora TaxID=43982 RepID=A0A9W6YLW2_AMBMO|nr:unnamed protein product [Ambrosiozyma monospora]
MGFAYSSLRETIQSYSLPQQVLTQNPANGNASNLIASLTDHFQFLRWDIIIHGCISVQFKDGTLRHGPWHMGIDNDVGVDWDHIDDLSKASTDPICSLTSMYQNVRAITNAILKVWAAFVIHAITGMTTTLF